MSDQQYYVVDGRWRGGEWYLLRLFSDGADAERFAQNEEGVPGPPECRIHIITDASLGGPHRHFWTIHEWSWENYRWEDREPRADCIPLKDGCSCGETRTHVADTPWPRWAESPQPSYEVVRAEAGPRPRKSRAKVPA